MHSVKKDAGSHPSLPNLQAGLFPESVFYLASSVRAPGYKECEYFWTSVQEAERKWETEHKPPAAAPHRSQPKASPYVWLPPMQPTALAGGTKSIWIPPASADGHPALPGLSQAVNRLCWHHWAHWTSSAVTESPCSHQPQTNCTLETTEPRKDLPVSIPNSSTAPGFRGFSQKTMFHVQTGSVPSVRYFHCRAQLARSFPCSSFFLGILG